MVNLSKEEIKHSGINQLDEIINYCKPRIITQGPYYQGKFCECVSNILIWTKVVGPKDPSSLSQHIFQTAEEEFIKRRRNKTITCPEDTEPGELKNIIYL